MSARIPVLLVTTRTDVTEALYGDPGASRYELAVQAPGALNEPEAARVFPLVLIDAPSLPDGLALARRFPNLAPEIELVMVVEDERQGVQAVRAGAFDYVLWPPASSDVLWHALSRSLDRVVPAHAVPESIGRYRILRKLGAGGMAEVFLARPHSGREARPAPDVVLKRMLPQYAGEAEFVDMFVAEARLAAFLSHPNVVEVADVGVVDEALFLVMEYVPGRNLDQVLRAAGTRLEFPLACHIVAEVCSGLAYAHGSRDRSGQPLSIIHRDVNPPNILLSEDGRVKLSDFGIAKHAQSRAHTTAGEIKGKVAYTSPEQVAGRPIDHRSDIFSVGTVLYLLLTGIHPFRGTTPLQTMHNIRNARFAPPSSGAPGVPPELDPIVARALACDPDDRYGSAAELAEDLRRVVATAGAGVGAADVAALVVRAGGRSTLPWETLVATGSFGPARQVSKPPPEAPSRTVSRPSMDRDSDTGNTVRSGNAAPPTARAARQMDTVVRHSPPPPVPGPRSAEDPRSGHGTVISSPEATVVSALAHEHPSRESITGLSDPPPGAHPSDRAFGNSPDSIERTDPTARRPASSRFRGNAVAGTEKRPSSTLPSWRGVAVVFAVALPLGAMVSLGIMSIERMPAPNAAPVAAPSPSPTPFLSSIPFVRVSPTPPAAVIAPSFTPRAASPITNTPARSPAAAVRAPAERGKGTLTIWMPSGWASVFIDGRAAGNAPVIGIQVTEGRRRVMLENTPAGFRREYEVVIAPGKETVLRVPFP